MIGLTSLEVYNSIFKITEDNIEFELYTDNFDKFSHVELKDEHEEILDFSNITAERLQVKMNVPRLFSAYKKLETKKRRTDGYYMFLLVYSRSPLRDFESYLEIVVGLDEDEIQLI